MLDEEKIKLMTRITIYEKNQEHGELSLSKYYKEDYVKYGCLKTLIVSALCYWIVIAIYVLMHLEELMNDLNSLDYFTIGKELVKYCVIVMIIFYVYAFIVYNVKYTLAKPGLIQYNKDLKQLISMYEADEAKEDVMAGRVKVYSEIGGEMISDRRTS
ncbi:MAG: hypothetical protein K6B68_13565 [Eubacterium sp.]|nr:hypothetical protein [Eubacterium sp.]